MIFGARNRDDKRTPPKSQVKLFGEYESECGYCHTGQSKAYGLESPVILSEDYDQLMNRGFRRSGKFFYKPTMHATCCPLYTIRLPVANFYLMKSQKNTLKKLFKHLNQSNAAPTTSTTETEATHTETKTTNETTSSFVVETVPAEFTQERYELYRKYQISVHNDPSDKITPESFTRFLIESPLHPLAQDLPPYDRSLPSLPTPTQFFPSSTEINTSSPSDQSPSRSSSSSKPYSGTYHQLYRLNGILVAVSVLDLLPTGVSSVYCFYDPDYKSLELGKYTALYEIAYTHHLRLPFYYMGFYIPSCPKMAYKSEYHPSELLCPTSLQWYPLTSPLKELLIQHSFLPLDPRIREQYLQYLQNQSQEQALASAPSSAAPPSAAPSTAAPSSAAPSSAAPSTAAPPSAAPSTAPVASPSLPSQFLPIIGNFQRIQPENCHFFLGEYSSQSRLLTSRDLTREGKEIVENILQEFLLLCDQPVGERILYRFN